MGVWGAYAYVGCLGYGGVVLHMYVGVWGACIVYGVGLMLFHAGGACSVYRVGVIVLFNVRMWGYGV